MNNNKLILNSYSKQFFHLKFFLQITHYPLIMFFHKNDYYYPLSEHNMNADNIYENGKIIKSKEKTTKNSISYSHYAKNLQSFYNDNDFKDQYQNSIKNKNTIKLLKLDDSLCQNQIFSQARKKQFYIEKDKKVLSKTLKINLKNPFQQILNQTDTPDFITSVPFFDEFSQIDLKSPTFSDIFNSEDCKSLKVCTQNKKYFQSTIKKESKINFKVNTQKPNILIQNQESGQNFLHQIQQKKCRQNKNFQAQLQNTKFRKNYDQQFNLSNKNIEYKKISSGFKLKKHFNLDQLVKLTLPPINLNDHQKDIYMLNSQINAQQSLIAQDPIQKKYNVRIKTNSLKTNNHLKCFHESSQYFKQNSSTKLFTEIQSQTQNKRMKKVSPTLQKIQQQMKIKQKAHLNLKFKKQLQQQMQLIYKGKFKLQRTQKMRF